MIKHLTLLLAAALLVFNLTACGCSAEGSGSNGGGSAVVGGETSGTTNDSASSNTGTSNGESGSGTGGSSGSSESGAGGSSGSGSESSGSQSGSGSSSGSGSNGNTLLDDAKDALDGTSAKAGGVSFREMVRNGRVHDTDGDLMDGENSRSDQKLF